MNYIKQIKNFFNKTDSRKTDETTTEITTLKQTLSDKTSRRSLNYRLKKHYKYRIELELKNWKAAVSSAEDVFRPNRELLYSLYRGVMDDSHLLSQTRTALKIVRLSDFQINKNGKTQNELKEFFKKPWFKQMIAHIVDTEWYGHTLVEFDPRMKTGEFDKINIIPREHVRPEHGEVVIEVHDEKGLPFRNTQIGKYLVEIGEPDDLGLLKAISRVVIRKEYALTDWSRRSEKFGMPMVIVRTTTRDAKELDKKEEMLSNLGTNGYAILDDMDEIQFLESQNAGGQGHLIYKDMSEYYDKSISLLVNGQTGTSEEKAHVGSAEVHERILNDYTLDRLSSAESFINSCLIPFLIRHGYPLADCKFQYLDLLKKEKTKKDQDKTSIEKDEEPEPSSKKKDNPLEQLYKKSQHEQPLNLSIDLNDLIDKIIRLIWEQKIKVGDIEAETWRHDVGQLWEATQKGVGKKLLDINYKDRDYELLNELRQNIHVFAAFKNHHHIVTLTNELIDPGTNRFREWTAFRDIAKPITQNYFENWLKAEYQTAVATGQMAVKWNDFAANTIPNAKLKYQTVGDARVRDTHKILDNITLPQNAPFWDQFYPPNGWNCRCTVLQVFEENENAPLFLPNEEQVHPAFRHNPAKSKELYSQSHPYFEDVPSDQRINIEKAAKELGTTIKER